MVNEHEISTFPLKEGQLIPSTLILLTSVPFTHHFSAVSLLPRHPPFSLSLPLLVHPSKALLKKLMMKNKNAPPEMWVSPASPCCPQSFCRPLCALPHSCPQGAGQADVFREWDEGPLGKTQLHSHTE